jgi:hypothetical protein
MKGPLIPFLLATYRRNGSTGSDDEVASRLEEMNRSGAQRAG